MFLCLTRLQLTLLHCISMSDQSRLVCKISLCKKRPYIRFQTVRKHAYARIERPYLETNENHLFCFLISAAAWFSDIYRFLMMSDDPSQQDLLILPITFIFWVSKCCNWW